MAGKTQSRKENINDKDEYIATPSISYSAGRESDFVYTHRDSSVEPLPKHLSALLEKIAKLRTVDEHIELLQNEGWSGEDKAEIREGIVELWRRGFLHSRSEIIEGMRENDGFGDHEGAIRRIGWITRDRTNSLLRSLESAVVMSEKLGRPIAFTIIDDSSSAETSKQLQIRLKEIVRDKSLQVLYAGDEERRQFALELARYVGPNELIQDAIHFALHNEEGMEFAPGVNRNALLISTIGEMFIHADDDTIFQFSIQENTLDELEISSVFDPTDKYFYGDREELLANISTETLDCIAYHEKLLGKRVGECLPESDGLLHLEEIGRLLAFILQGGGGQVRATMTGICGDSGLRQPGMLLYLTGEVRERVMSNESLYREALLTREVDRKAQRFTISEGSFFMMPNIGLDNREILPPFFPTSRNSDGLFGATLRSCLNEALIGYLPIGVYHDPPGSRHFAAEELTQISNNMADLVILLVLSFRYSHEIKNINDRFRSLGDYLKRVGSLEEKAFTEFVKTRRLTETSQNIQHLYLLLETYSGSPDFWCDDVLNRIETLRTYAQSEYIDIPTVLFTDREPKEARALCRRLIRQFGELLYWWPEIIEAAKELQDSGKGMLREL